MAARGAHWKGKLSPKEAEAVVIRESLHWLKSLTVDNIVIETDSLQVVQSINSELGELSFHLILADVKNLISLFPHCRLCFIKRSVNLAVHMLATQYRLSVSLSNMIAQSGSHTLLLSFVIPFTWI